MQPSQHPGATALGFIKKYYYVIALILIGLLSFGLNFYGISKIGYGNGYYAAAVKSMSESFHNFFYVSFDPAGVVSVDKPPLGLWIQTLFVLVFGYHGWAMLLPQALAGTGACLMMYLLLSKYFGRPAGLVAALVFALTPAVAVASRNNTMDSQLILCLVTAAWFLFKSIDTGKWRHLFLAAVIIGLGFNIKMLQAYMILPAVVLVYLLFAKGKFLKRLLAGAISLIIMAVISFAWVAAVDLTPSSQRPYVGSSTDNTVLELIIGHNGMERLYGQGGGARGSNFGPMGSGNQRPDGNWGNGTRPDGAPNVNGGAPNGGTPGGLNGPGSFSPGQNGGPGGNSAPGQNGGIDGNRQGGMGGGGNDIGSAGLFRLWTQSLYGQVAWLLALCLFCVIIKIKKFSFKNLTVQQAMFIFWLVWVVTMFGFFSFASFWHRYYLCMFAPGIAGLCGIGIPALVRAFRDRQSWRQFVLPGALLGTLGLEAAFVWGYAAVRSWLLPIMLVSTGLALVATAVFYVQPKRFLVPVATGLMLLSLLVGPFYWALTTVLYVEQNSTLPYAGPELASTAAIPGQTANQEVLTSGDSGTNALEAYLVAHYKEGTYLVVSQRANDVAQFIVDTGLPAVAYGGFLGSDNAITLDTLKTLVANGTVTYFLVSGQSGNSELASYVKQNATLIDASEYLGNATAKTGGNNGIGNASLYLFK